VSAITALRELGREPGFRRLYATRLISQAADGMLQASLASAVFFNPEHTTDARTAAAGFSVLLLPYSLVGPFAGVLLDRWRRQRVLVHANYVRTGIVCLVAALLGLHGPDGVGFYAAALAAVSVNRFFLSALSVSLPHVVRRDQLIVGNSVSTTSGYLATVAGGALGLGLRALTGGGDAGNALIALSAAGGYLLSSRVAAGFADPDVLGPDRRPATPDLVAELRDVLRGLAEGARHVESRRPAAYALAAIGAHRFCYGISTIATLLLYRNYFTDSGFFRAGLVGLGQVFAAGALGVVLAAAVTPAVTARIGKPACVVTLFALASVVEVVLGVPYTKPALVGAAFLLAVVAQGSKICVDTIVQETIDDELRGRVFAGYDTLFNLSFVLAAVCGALVLPTSGKSYAVLACIAAGYAVTALSYGLASRRAWATPAGALSR